MTPRAAILALLTVTLVLTGCAQTEPGALGLAENQAEETTSLEPAANDESEPADPPMDPQTTADASVAPEASGDPAAPETDAIVTESSDDQPPPEMELSTRRVGTIPPGCFGTVRLFCRDANLQGYDFRGVSLRFADFWGADLTGARFDNATLLTTSFRETKLSGASFVGADLTRTVFTRSDIQGADFRQANLTYAWVDFAQAQRANFTGAQIERASFRDTNLTGATWIDGRTCVPPPFHQSIGSCS